jgi:GT2 family glycosyltransferase
MLVSLIIVNYKTEKYVLNCISSIHKQSKGVKYEIVVVDNSSSSVKLKNKLSAVGASYIDAGGNIGFGRACNLGAASANGEIFVFVNPDITFLENVIEQIQSAIIKSDVKTIVGVNLFNDAGKNTVSGGSFPSISSEILELLCIHKFMPKLSLNWSLARIYSSENLGQLEVDYVSGALFGMTAENFRSLSGFSNKFFLYFEETELMYRHQKNDGKVILLLKASAKHAGSVSTLDGSDFKLSQLEFGRYLFYRTRYKGYIPFLIVRIIRSFRLLLFGIFKKKKIFIQLIPTALLGKNPNFFLVKDS